MRSRRGEQLRDRPWSGRDIAHRGSLSCGKACGESKVTPLAAGLTSCRKYDRWVKVILGTDASARLAGRVPTVTPERLLAELVPPPRFASARFGTYVPDPAEPSQAAARDLLAPRAARSGNEGRASRFSARRLLRGSGAGGSASGGFEGKSGVYLDGGYGVGKTHLLASLWHAAEGQKAYGTFVE